ncbi:M28 family metallopeptidase [Streptosporangium sp. CA-115845]|uniref:M28 family metallopeptidase n=1 Tax=Streptosporangium sp. CA-115845 TaxID=3240071 RepID=UPI003D907252
MSARAFGRVLAAVTIASVTIPPVANTAWAATPPGTVRGLATSAAEPGLSSEPPPESPLPPDAKAFGQSIKLASVRRHLERLQEIAKANGGIRAAATPGHEASVAYVADRLRAAGYQVTLQEFGIPFFHERKAPVLARSSPAARAYLPGVDFQTMTYSGSGKITAPVQGVDLVLPPAPNATSSSGCEVSDFKGFVRGNIALIQRGSCSFQAKAERAQAAGASGVVIFNEGQPGEALADRRILLRGSVNTSSIKIPIVGATFAAGKELSAPGTTATLAVDAESDPDRRTRNVIAESRRGDPDRVVMLGAHLDSVMAGPGINDNGSGTAGVLETALAAKDLRTRNRLRFAFWGAEELGLLGSTHYVAHLSAAERTKIKLYLNFDMIASPNHVLGIYDGDNSDTGLDTHPPAGSDRIERLFQAYFDAVGKPHQDADFTGRSDYGPFIKAGIAAGGLFTGAEGIKSAEEAAKFGGKAWAPYDRCYHQACDTLANIDDGALAVNASAIGAAAYTYAYARDLPGDPITPGPAGGPRVGGPSRGPSTGGGGLGHDHRHEPPGLLR